MKKILNYFKLVLILFCLCLVGCSSSNKVSEKEWDDALSLSAFSNCKVELTYGYYIGEGVGKKMDVYEKVELVFANEKQYAIDWKYDDDELELDGEYYYHIKENGYTYEYSRYSDKDPWEMKITYDNPCEDVILELSELLTSMLNYSDFKYNEASDSYVYQNDLAAYKVSFKNNKISNFNISYSNDYVINIKVSGYGRQRVVLPII